MKDPGSWSSPFPHHDEDHRLRHILKLFEIERGLLLLMAKRIPSEFAPVGRRSGFEILERKVICAQSGRRRTSKISFRKLASFPPDATMSASAQSTDGSRDWMPCTDHQRSVRGRMQSRSNIVIGRRPANLLTLPPSATITSAAVSSNKSSPGEAGPEEQSMMPTRLGWVL